MPEQIRAVPDDRSGLIKVPRAVIASLYEGSQHHPEAAARRIPVDISRLPAVDALHDRHRYCLTPENARTLESRGIAGHEAWEVTRLWSSG